MTGQQKTLKPYQNKIIKPINSTEFLRKLRLEGLFDLLVLPKYRQTKYPPEANISFIIFKKVKKFKTDTAALRHIEKNTLFEELGYDPDNLPTRNTIANFRKFCLTKEGEKQLLEIVEEYRSDNSIFIRDSNLPFKEKPKKSNLYATLSTQDKRIIVRYCINYIIEHCNVDMRHNAIYKNEEIFNAICYFLADAGTAHSVSAAYRNDSIPGIKKSQKCPTDRTILDRLRKMFKNRKDVEDFFDFLFNKIMLLLKQKMPELFNRKKINIAFDYTDVPTYENMHKFKQKKLTPESMKRNIYTNPAHIIKNSSKKDKGTYNFRKFLCSSIIINGFRFCVAYKAIDMVNNSEQTKLLNELISKIKKYFGSRNIHCAYLDREFDTFKTHQLLQRRGIKYVIQKKRDRNIKGRINAFKGDIGYFPHKISRQVDITVIVLKGKYRNKFSGVNNLEDSNGETVFAFSTNMRVTKHNARAIVDGYRSRWGIETMFRDKNRMYGKTTSNDSMIRDFYFAYTMVLFNVWILCNIILCFIYLNIEPGEPKLRMYTFRKYIQGTEFRTPSE